MNTVNSRKNVECDPWIDQKSHGDRVEPGGFPEVVLMESPDQKRQQLRQLTADYLLKDIFAREWLMD
jgi:predicted AAA+ superfamily ATPase